MLQPTVDEIKPLVVTVIYGLWSVLRSVLCGMCSAVCGVWCVVCILWAVACGFRTVVCGPWSVICDLVCNDAMIV